jgi:spore coat protein CotH
MPAPPASPGRRLLHRIPVRVRHYWKLLAGGVALVAVLTLVVSTERVQPYVTSTSDESGDEVTQDVAGTTDLFDSGRAHTMKVTFHDLNYQKMLDAYFADGEKEYVEADLTVDGTTISSVGIRLKGNSTLGGLTRDGKAREGGFGPGGGRGRPGGGGPGGGFARASLKAEEPESLPWLIRFDEFVEGRRYQGHREIAVRVAGMGGGATVLNEALSLNLLAGAGEVTQRYAYSSFTVNGRPTVARLVVEHPDEHFADDMPGSGVLYKSLATGQFTDQGDDPTDYADDFKQITKKGSQDLQPVIDLIKWVNHSSDAEFDRHLGDHVDLASFARYTAAQNLLLNFDDMAGPGRNYYLWYDLGTKRFSVIGWDYNLTFSGNAEQGPHDSTSMGGGFPGGMQPPDGMQLPDGMQIPEGMQPPEGMGPPGGGAPDADEDAAGPARRGFGGNKLKERFLAGQAFTQVYEDAYRDLYGQFFGNGTALTALDGITKVLATTGGYNAETATNDAQQLRTLIEQRTKSLAGNEVIKTG